jgi:uncharacterized small protein (DUF1192 family)
MPTTIKDIKRSETTTVTPPVESEKVSRFLKLRYKLRKAKESATGKLDELTSKLDPRANQEDYLRRRQRLLELVNETREDPALGNDAELVKALNSAHQSIEQADLAVATSQSKNQRPDYGVQRDALKSASERLQLAITTATKRVEKLDKDNPGVANPLQNVGNMLDDAATKASPDQLEAWRGQFATITKTYYGPSPNIDKVTSAVNGLAQQMSNVLMANAKRAEAIRLKTAKLNGLLATSNLPIEELAPVDGLIKRAGREATALDFDAADSSLLEAENKLPQGTQTPAPSIGDVEKRRDALYKKALAAIPTIKDGEQPPVGAVVSAPARERVKALLKKLEELRPLCRQTDAVAIEALRRVQACEEEFKRIQDQDSAVAGYAREKQSFGEFIDGKIAYLEKEFARQKPDGGLIAMKLRLDTLKKSFGADWSKLMTQSEIEASGLLAEATKLDEDYDEWKNRDTDEENGAKGWQQDFHAATQRLAQATQVAREQDVGLFQLLGLATKMPALVSKGGSLIASQDQVAAEKEVRTITLQLLDVARQVDDHLEQAKADPGAFDAMVQEGEKLAAGYVLTIDQQIASLEELQPGKKMEKAKKLVKFFKESAFSDDGEREIRIKYGTTLKDNLDGLLSLLRCKDSTAVPAALEDIKAFQWKVKDFEDMAKSGGKPSEKMGSAPPPFSELQERIKAIQKEIEKGTKDSDLSTRVDTLKGWSEQASNLSEEMGETDPRELETRIGALEREIVSTTAKDKIEIGKAKVQSDALLKLLMRVMDARKKGSPLLKDFAPLLADMQRRGEAMRKAVDQWKVTDAGFDAFKKEVDSLLDTKRKQEDTQDLEKKSSAAAKQDQEVEAARTALLKLRDADLKLWREKIEKYDDKEQKKTLLKLVDDLTKGAERGLDALNENRDAQGAEALVRSSLREISEAASGRGDKLTKRGDLKRLNDGWINSVKALGDKLVELEKAVLAASNGAADDIVAAAAALRKQTIDPVTGLFDAKVFAASFKGLESADAGVRATHREAALSEVRRLRRVMESDNRVRVLALDNPFGVVVPFPEISSRLFDIEVNVTRARGA